MSNLKEFSYDISDDFIGVFYNVFPAGYCEQLIQDINMLQEQKIGYFRKDSEGALNHFKNDWALDGRTAQLSNFEGNNPKMLYRQGLQKCFDIYTEKYSTLRTAGNVTTTTMKIQKTVSGGGYHPWHHEQGEGEFASRAVVFMVYLNTLDEASCGETEFLYQQRRLNPTENTVVLWPAAYTHVHRGNPVYGDASKFIITGWFHYDE